MLRRLDKHCRAILQRSTFCVIGTQGPDGADVSPRGDPAGFVRMLDDRHLLLPDRIGNNRFDSYANVFANPQVGLLFLVPGMAEILRINGTGARDRRCGPPRAVAPCRGARRSSGS